MRWYAPTTTAAITPDPGETTDTLERESHLGGILMSLRDLSNEQLAVLDKFLNDPSFISELTGREPQPPAQMVAAPEEIEPPAYEMGKGPEAERWYQGGANVVPQSGAIADEDRARRQDMLKEHRQHVPLDPAAPVRAPYSRWAPKTP